MNKRLKAQKQQWKKEARKAAHKDVENMIDDLRYLKKENKKLTILGYVLGISFVVSLIVIYCLVVR
jgi:hypothetical protein